MRFRKPSPAMVVALIALVLATAGTAFAATGQLVTIVDPATGHTANVDSTGRLNVGDGSGPMSVDGTTTSHEAPGSALFHSLAFPNGTCAPLATPPAGKALIIKSVSLDTFTIGTPGDGVFADLFLGATTCESLVMEINPPGVGLINQPFEPGLGVPAGQRLWVRAFKISAVANAFGYVTGAGSVPASSPSASEKLRSPQS